MTLFELHQSFNSRALQPLLTWEVQFIPARNGVILLRQEQIVLGKVVLSAYVGKKLFPVAVGDVSEENAQLFRASFLSDIDQ